MNFEIRKSTGKEEYQFFLVDNNLRILTGNTFDNRENCIEAIRTLINSGGDTNNYNAVKEGNDYFVTISLGDGNPLALSQAYATEEEAQDLKNNLPNEFFDNREFKVKFITTRKTIKKVKSIIEYYDFEYKYAGNKGFDTYKKDKDGLFYYAYNYDGRTIFYGRSQKSQSKRKNDIWALITRSDKDSSFDTIASEGSYYFIFKDKKGKEIARSATFATRSEASTAMSALRTALPNYKSAFSTAGKEKARKKRQKAGPNDDYDFTQVSSSGVYGFEAFRNKENKGHFFHFNDDNGNATIYSQNYSSAKSRDNGIRSIIRNGVLENRYIRKTTDKGQHYFTLKAGNNQEIGRSRTFASQAEMEAFILSLRTRIIDFAETYGLEKDVILSSIITETETFTLERDEDEEALGVSDGGPQNEETDLSASMNDDYLECEEYDGHPRSEAFPEFSIFEKGGEYYFAMLDASDRVLLRSEGYTTTHARDNGIKSVIKNRENETRRSITKAFDHYFVILKAGNHQEIGRSCALDSEAAALNLFVPPVSEELGATGGSNAKDDDYLTCDEYKGHARSDAFPEFSTFEKNREYYFALLNAKDEVLLRSEGYTTTSARDNGIKSVIKNRDNEKRRFTKEIFGHYFLILKAGNHQEIARSCALDSEGAALNLFAPLVGATDGKKPREDDYLKCDEYVGHARSEAYPEFSTFEKDGEYYFALLNAKDEVLLRSEGYTTTSSRENGIKSVIKNRELDVRRTVVEKFNHYFVILKAGNHQEIGRSCALDSEAAALSLLLPVVEESVQLGADSNAPVTKDDDYLVCDDYKGHERSEKYPEFSTFEKDGEYYFAMLDQEGNVLLRSEGYTTTSSRENGIKSVIKNRELDVRRTVVEKFNHYFVILKAGNHQEIGRSCALDSEAAALSLLLPVVEESVQLGADSNAPVTKDDDYLVCDDYKGHERSEKYPEFSTFEKDGEYYFAMLDQEGNVLLRSEGYTTTSSRENGIKSVIKNRELDVRRTVVEKFNHYFIILKAGNHQEIGRSCAIEDEAGTTNWFAALGLMGVSTGAINLGGEGENEESPVYDHEEFWGIEDGLDEVGDDDYLTCAEYKNRPINDKVHNVALFRHDDGQFYFALYDDDDNVKLRSEGFITATARDQELSGVLRFHDNPDMYEKLEKGQYYMMVLKDETGREVGRSCLMKDGKIIVPVAPVAAVPVLADAELEDNYLICDAYKGHERYEAYPDFSTFEQDGLHYFALLGEGNEVLLRSEGYTTIGAMENGMQSVLNNKDIEERRETVERLNHYFVILKAANHKEIARSCAMEEEGAALGWLSALGLVGAGIGAGGIGGGFGGNVDIPIDDPAPIPEPVVVEEVVDNSYVDDGAAAGAGAAAGGAAGLGGCLSRLWPWLLGLLLLLLLLWLLSKGGCSGCNGDGVAGDADANNTEITTDNETDANANNGAGTDTNANNGADGGDGSGGADTGANGNANNGGEVKLLGPTADELGFKKGSAIALMADCLADPNCDINDKKFTLGIVHFGENDAHMNPDAYAEMDDLAKLMNAYPNMKIDIFGHIDDQESDTYTGKYQDGNITLSAIRARCVYKKLLQRGVSKSRMTFKGFADSQPVVSNDSNANRIKNRRVEVVITQR